MKTPREILFQRHQSVCRKLDTVRETALATVASKADRRSNERKSLTADWREILVSWRWHLSGLSAAWLLIAILNIEPSPAPMQNVARQTSPAPHSLLASLRENRRQMVELTEGPFAVPAFPPPRRSESAATTAMA